MPPIKCTPCRVTYEGQRYHVLSNGDVYPCYLEYREQPDYESTVLQNKSWTDGPNKIDATTAKLVRREASRQRRNRNARTRNQAMRDLGMKRTSHGWE